MKNLIVGQSGGPTAVINASMCGVLTEAFRQTEDIRNVYGMVNGIEGILNHQLIELNHLKDSDELELIRTTPGSYLGSCRRRLPDSLEDPVYPLLFRQFNRHDIGYFFYIGGNDSMDTVNKLSKYASRTGSAIKIMGIPKTIDNDLAGTDHTPGFGCAAKYVASAVRSISVDAGVYSNIRSVTIVEIMGRHAGWLTASSILARQYKGDNPVLVYTPEFPFSQEAFLERVARVLETVPNPVICISEGINDGNAFICEYAKQAGTDSFGHKMLAGAGKYLENLVQNRLHVKVRSIELNVCQRCSPSSLSATDLNEAFSSGSHSVRAALKGETGKMTVLCRSASPGYSINYRTVDVDTVCNVEKLLPQHWIINDGSDISDDFISYAKPLIQGSVDLPMEDGLPKFSYRQRIPVYRGNANDYRRHPTV